MQSFSEILTPPPSVTCSQLCPHFTHLGHQESCHYQEGGEGKEEEGETPLLVEGHDKATEEGGQPLDEQPHLVTYAIMDLVQITAGREKGREVEGEKRGRKIGQ